MKFRGLFVGVLFALFVITAYAEPEADPEADPSALAEADASADPSSPSKSIKHMIKNRSRKGRCSKCTKAKKCKSSCNKSYKKASRKKRTCHRCVPGGIIGGFPGGFPGTGVAVTQSSGGNTGNNGNAGTGITNTQSSGDAATSGTGIAATTSSSGGTATSAAGQLLNYCQYNCDDVQNIGCGATRTMGPNCPSGASSYIFSDSDINLILSLANDARNSFANGSMSGFSQASRMPRMTWNAPLAELALYNAQLCSFAHDECHNTDQYSRPGQNLGYTEASGGYQTITDAISQVHNGWVSEYTSATMNDINSYPTDASRQALFDHFTQVVRDLSPQMGCAASMYTADNGLFRTEIVCNYASTNLEGAPVYTAGNSCSGCTSGCDAQYTALCTSNESVDANSTS